MAHHALVFGASGILGWSIVDQILKNYPETGSFSKVTALSNRPLSEKDAFWPVGGSGNPTLQIVDGIDLTSGTMEEMREKLQSRISDIETVTHIYYFGTIPANPASSVPGNLPLCSLLVPCRFPHRIQDQS